MKIYALYSIFEPLVISHYKHVLSTIDIDKDTVIHVRSEYLGYIFKKIKKYMGFEAPVLVDVRGVMTEEWKYRFQRLKGVRKLLTIIQSWYFGGFSKRLFNNLPKTMAVTSVSDTISRFLKNTYNISEKQLFVNPNIAGTQFVFSKEKRKEVREKYGIKENDLLAVCSTGGGEIWQKDYQVIPILLKKGIKVINLAKRDPRIEGCVTTTVPFKEMPAMLSAADIAVLWREDTFMNNSASPSKFSEFSKMGLFVIHNGSVDIAKDYIISTGAGAIVKNIEDITNIALTTDILRREEWIAAGTKKFGMDSIGENYTDIYKSILNS